MVRRPESYLVGAVAVTLACSTTLDPTIVPPEEQITTPPPTQPDDSMQPNDPPPQSEPTQQDELPMDPDGDPVIDVCQAFGFGASELLFCNALRTFDEAVSDCERFGGMLVKVDSAEKNAALEAAQSSGGNAWIGGRRDDNLLWTWRDGTPFWQGDGNGMPVNGAYSNWMTYPDIPAEPDNTSRTVRHDEECAAFGGQWLDRYCGLVLTFFCERPAPADAGAL